MIATPTTSHAPPPSRKKRPRPAYTYRGNWRRMIKEARKEYLSRKGEFVAKQS